LTNLDKDTGWRWYIGLSAIPVWLLVLSFAFIPESARYCSACGQEEEAEKLIRKMFTDNKKYYPKGILVVGTETKANRGKVKDLFVPAYRTTSVIMLTNFFSVTFCYYGICFISERLFKSGNLYRSIFLTTLSEMPGIFIAVFFLDWTGRKGMMKICWFVFGTLTLLTTLLPPTDSSSSLQRTFDVTFVFIGRCAISTLFFVLFIYFSEYYPTVIRTTALGFASSMGRIAGMITTFVAEDTEVVAAMLIYTIFGFFSFFLTVLLPQDTTGMEMRDQVDRGKVEMSTYSRNRDEDIEDDLRELSGGIKGKVQRLKANALTSLRTS